MRVKVNAKINLFLRVTGLLDTGRHTLEMLTVSVSVADGVRVTLRDDGKINLSMDTEIPQVNNAYRAAEDYILQYGLDGADISIDKNIPIAAGMGGSAADTAAVIYALRALSGQAEGLRCQKLVQDKTSTIDSFKSSDILTHLDTAEIRQRYGDDVPFLLKGGIELRQDDSVGEENSADSYLLEKALDVLSGFSVVIVKPFCGLKTQDVFCEYDRLMQGKQAVASGDERVGGREVGGKSLQSKADVYSLLQAICRRDYSQISDNLYNDLEQAALRLQPQLKEVRQELKKSQAFAYSMTGSGNAFFGLYADKAQAQRAEVQLQNTGMFEQIIMCGFERQGIYHANKLSK